MVLALLTTVVGGTGLVGTRLELAAG